MINPLTKQEAFDKAALGVINQGRPASKNQSCKYIIRLGDTKLHCGVGHLLPDDATCELWDTEEYSMSEYEAKFFSKSDLNMDGIGLGELTPKFLNALQQAHDGASDRADFIAWFKYNMRDVAGRFNVSPAVLD